MVLKLPRKLAVRPADNLVSYHYTITARTCDVANPSPKTSQNTAYTGVCEGSFACFAKVFTGSPESLKVNAKVLQKVVQKGLEKLRENYKTISYDTKCYFE